MSKPLFQIVEALRLLHTHTGSDGKKTAKVYRDNEWQEYRVKHYIDGQHLVDGDYHTDDQDDAHGTAKEWLGEEEEMECDDENCEDSDKEDPEYRPGYPTPRDPKMLPEKPGQAARFIAKHMVNRNKPRVTDIDKSTLDDKLFSGSNMERSVPEGGVNRHGHVPTGKDAKVYETAPAGKKKPKADEKDDVIEQHHDRTLARHGDAIKRSKAEVYHEGWKQDFGPDKSSITSKTSMGCCTTDHDHGTRAIKHTWTEDGK